MTEETRDEKMDILVPKKQHFRCFENIVAFIAEKYGLRYEVMFARMWDFKFSVNNKGGLLSERLTANFRLAEDYLKEFSGLGFLPREEMPEDFIRLCRKEISEGRYVIIPVFRQDILKKYRKVDRKPNTVLMLVDIAGDKFCCVDIHGEVGENRYAKIVEIEETDFLEGAKEDSYNVCITYKIEKKVDKRTLREFLGRQVERLLKKDDNGYNAFQEMKEFAREINKNTVIEEVCENVSAEKYPFVEKIKEICRGRFLFHYFVKTFLSEGDTFFAACVQEMNEVGTYWSTIMSLLLKMYYKKDFTYVKKISDMVRRASVLEEHLAQKIQLYLESGKDENLYKNRSVFDLDPSSERIDLSPHLNNKGISFEDGEKAGYNELGYMRLDKKEDFQKLFQSDGRGHDNIVCKGQRIELKSKKGEALLILANSEGYRSDFIAIHYSDGEEEEKLLGVSNWFGEPMFGEKIVVEGERFKNTDKYKDTGGNTGDKANIFGYAIPIRKNQEMEYMILPDCPDIHIFNIFVA